MSHASLRRSLIIGLFASIVSASVLGAAITGAQEVRPKTPKLDVPYVPTPQPVVDKMLEMAQVRGDDFLIDLGSGDGRIPITAAQRYGTRGFGVDINPERVTEARENARRAGVTEKVEFREANLFNTDISDATVLTLYLLPDVNLKLRPRILGELRPGTRVVSHAFDMGDWNPERTEVVEGKTVYLWTVPAKVEGKWQVADKGGNGQSFALTLNQRYQELSGTATIDGRSIPIRDGRIQGDRVSFELASGEGQPRRYEGRLVEGRLQGEGWQATRSS
jgi:hypothetical protein